MKAHLVALVRGAPSPHKGIQLSREYLQALVLAALQRAGAMVPLAFQGGTALRFLYQLPRYSEDLDFALERPGAGTDLRADLRGFIETVRRDLVHQGYTIELKLRDERAVWSGHVRFPGLPHELGLSPHASQVLSIKVEVDTYPPAGAGLETSIIRRFELLHLQHHDRPTLLAGKLHAILARPHTKGRDLFDIAWYLAEPTWPAPNLTLLRNALAQTSPSADVPEVDDWRSLIVQRLQAVDWRAARADVRPFLERAEDENMVSHQNIVWLIEHGSGGR